MHDNKVYAEDINYWKSGQSSPDSWMEKAESEIEKAGGNIIGRAFAREIGSGEAFMLTFQLGDDSFRVVWPVLESKTDNLKAARRQAATMLYHDVKSKCVSAKVLGVRKSFISYLILADGRTVSETATYELSETVFRLPSGIK